MKVEEKIKVEERILLLEKYIKKILNILAFIFFIDISGLILFLTASLTKNLFLMLSLLIFTGILSAISITYKIFLVRKIWSKKWLNK
jgi:hypothetical protein